MRPLNRRHVIDMNSVNYRHINEHGIGENKHRLEWCPKYRYNGFQNPFIAKETRQILEQIAVEKGMTVHKIVVDSDHVHTFVSVLFDIPLSNVFQYLKRISAHRIFRLPPNFRKRYPKEHFWSHGHFSRSISCVTKSAI